MHMHINRKNEDADITYNMQVQNMQAYSNNTFNKKIFVTDGWCTMYLQETNWHLWERNLRVETGLL